MNFVRYMLGILGALLVFQPAQAVLAETVECAIQGKGTPLMKREDCLEEKGFPLANGDGAVEQASVEPVKGWAIVVSWEGYENPITGAIKRFGSDRQGAIQAALPGGIGGCKGVYTYNTMNQGTWAVNCSNGSAAAGFVTAVDKTGKAVGEGLDALGRKVKFTIGQNAEMLIP